MSDENAMHIYIPDLLMFFISTVSVVHFKTPPPRNTKAEESVLARSENGFRRRFMFTPTILSYYGQYTRDVKQLMRTETVNCVER